MIVCDPAATIRGTLHGQATLDWFPNSRDGLSDKRRAYEWKSGFYEWTYAMVWSFTDSWECFYPRRYFTRPGNSNVKKRGSLTRDSTQKTAVVAPARVDLRLTTDLWRTFSGLSLGFVGFFTKTINSKIRLRRVIHRIIREVVRLRWVSTGISSLRRPAGGMGAGVGHRSFFSIR